MHGTGTSSTTPCTELDLFQLFGLACLHTHVVAFFEFFLKQLEIVMAALYASHFCADLWLRMLHCCSLPFQFDIFAGSCFRKGKASGISQAS